MLCKSAILLALTTAMPAQAADGAVEIWKVNSGSVELVPAHIALPDRAGGLALGKTGEASQPGTGYDAIVQYSAPDTPVFATAFIYFPSYPDAALTALMTEGAIRIGFGDAVTLQSETLASAGGVLGAAIRRVYANGRLKGEGPITTAAAFVRAGRWIVVLRASGPAARAAEITATLDSLLAGIRFGDTARPLAAMPLSIGAPCPTVASTPAKMVGKSKDSGANMLMAALIGGSGIAETKDGTAVPDLAFPRNGADPVCIAGEIGPLKVLRSPSASVSTMLVPYTDTGDLLAVEPMLLSKGFQVKRYTIGRMDVLGAFRTMPTLAQLGAILDRTDTEGSAVRSSTQFKPDGNTEISIDPSSLD